MPNVILKREATIPGTPVNGDLVFLRLLVIPDHQSDILDRFTSFDFSKKKLEDWCELAKEVDFLARVWIEFIISKAATAFSDPDIDELLDNSYVLADSHDSKILRYIVGKSSVIDLTGIDEKTIAKDMEKKRIEKNIERLKKFSLINEAILRELQLDLDKYDTLK